MATQFQVQHIGNPHIDHSQESLILPFELALVEDLYGNHGGILDIAATRRERGSSSWPMDLHVKALIPVWVQSLLDNACRVGLLGVDGYDCKWIGKSEYIPLR